MFQQKKLWVLENINLFLNLFKWGGGFCPKFWIFGQEVFGENVFNSFLTVKNLGVAIAVPGLAFFPLSQCH